MADCQRILPGPVAFSRKPLGFPTRSSSVIWGISRAVRMTRRPYRGSASWQCSTWTTCGLESSSERKWCGGVLQVFSSFRLISSLRQSKPPLWFFDVFTECKPWPWKSCNPSWSSCTSPSHPCPIDLTKEGSTPISAGRMPHVFSEFAQRHSRSTKSRCFIPNTYAFDTPSGTFSTGCTMKG